MNRRLRREAARAWYERQPEHLRPAIDDVDVVAAMGIRETVVLNSLILQDPARLRTAWASLVAALGHPRSSHPQSSHQQSSHPESGHLESGNGTTIREDAPADGRAWSTPATREPVADERPADPPAIPASTDERMAALRAWRDREATTKSELWGLNDSDLRRIARSPAVSAEELGRLALQNKRVVLDNSDGISRTLRHAGQTGLPTVVGPVAEVVAEPEPPPEPINGSSPEPAHSVPSPARYSEWLTDRTFAAFSWDIATDPSAAVPITVERLEDDGGRAVRLSWPAAPAEADGWFAYRVVSSEEYPPTSAPDTFELLGVTRRTEAIDPRPMHRAVRHLAVWVNSGASEQEARNAQPRLHAVGRLLAGVRNLSLRVEAARVFGHWEAPAGMARARVIRVPAELAASRPGYDASYETDEINVKATGFTDRPSRGGVFEYRVFAVVQVDGTDVLAPPATARVTVDENVEPVQDLVTDRDGQQLRLRWTSPGIGTVEIYRVEVPPPQALTGARLSREALAVQLPAEHRLVQSVDLHDGQAVMTDVTMPAGWTRAYFVPVTVLDDRHLRVGRPAVLVLPQPPTELRLVERVSRQVLSFAWPAGVELVRVIRSPRGADPAATASRPLAELTRQHYDEQGGIHLPDPLPEDGCDLHVYGVMYHAGKPVLSEPAVIGYPGLHRLEYRIKIEQPPPAVPARTGFFGRSQPQQPPAPPVRRLQVRASRRLDRIRLILVHNPHRLPLTSHDGRVVFEQEQNLTPDEQPLVGGELPDMPGFIRLFVAGLPPGWPPVAVLDPPIQQLRQQSAPIEAGMP